LERLTRLRQHQQDGKRSPHKPLLVLLALGQFARTGSSKLEWTLVEERLGRLLAEFGPPRRGSSHPEFPFTRLRSDLVWQLSRDVPNDSLSSLREEPVTGQFVDDIETALEQDPGLVAQVARDLVEEQFPLTIAPDVLSAVGLDPDLVFRASGQPPAKQEIRKRSSQWRHQILEAWERSCAFCGFDGQSAGAPVGIEAAHVRWFNFGGPDDLDNGLALCSLHHKLFDRGVLGLDLGDAVVVSSTFSARTDEGKRVYELHGRELRPRPGTKLPSDAHVSWHAKEVFKGEALLV
jgi:putative restriction endonuclease